MIFVTKHNFILPLQQQQKFFMATFNSIWGDLTVGNVTPAEEKAPDPDKAPEVKDDLKHDEDDPVSTDPEEDSPEGDPKTEVTKKDPPKSKEPEEDDYEFEVDDVNKAFTMLADEGVIEIPEDADFDATPAGLADVVASNIRKGIQKEIQATPKAVQDLYAHVMNGGDPKEFKYIEPISWADVDEDDKDVQEESLRTLYLSQGMTPEEVQEEIEDVIASDKLAKKGAIAIAALAKKEQETTAAQNAAKEAKEAKAEQDRLDEIKELEDLIDSTDEMAGFKLDDSRKKAFKNYLLKPIARTGKTQMQSNMANEDRRLRIAFLDFIDYNKKDVENEIKSDLTKERKKKLTRFTGKNAANTNGSQSVKTKQDKNHGSIKFPSIFGTQELEVED